jgi:hypothetical protein
MRSRGGRNRESTTVRLKRHCRELGGGTFSTYG